MVVFAVYAALDWDWQIPALTLPAIGLGAALLIGVDVPRRRHSRHYQSALLVALLAPWPFGGRRRLTSGTAPLPPAGRRWKTETHAGR